MALQKLEKIKSNDNFILKKDSLYCEEKYLGSFHGCDVSFYSTGCLIVWKGCIDRGYRDYVFFNNKGDMIFALSNYVEDRRSGDCYIKWNVDLTIYDKMVVGDLVDRKRNRNFVASDYDGKKYKGKYLDEVESQYLANEAYERVLNIWKI